MSKPSDLIKSAKEAASTPGGIRLRSYTLKSGRHIEIHDFRDCEPAIVLDRPEQSPTDAELDELAALIAPKGGK